MELVAQIYHQSDMAYSAESEVYSESIQGQSTQAFCLSAVILTVKFKQEIIDENCYDWMKVIKRTSSVV